VVEDAGDVRGEEEFAVADADDGGRTHAGGDELVGLVRGEDTNGEGSGDALDGAADGFFEGECWPHGRKRFARREGSVRDDCLGLVRRLRADDGSMSTGHLKLVFDEVGDDLGVGFGDELVALGDKVFFNGEVVFDDAVVDDDEGAGAVAVGVGVLFGGAAVGGPPGVADAEGAVDGGVADDGFEVA